MPPRLRAAGLAASASASILQQRGPKKRDVEAEAALRELNDSVSEEEVTYLKFLDRAGTLKCVREVLTRDYPDKLRASPKAALPLLCKFARHNIGYQRNDAGYLIPCEECRNEGLSYWRILTRITGYS